MNADVQKRPHAQTEEDHSHRDQITLPKFSHALSLSTKQHVLAAFLLKNHLFSLAIRELIKINLQ